MAYKATRRRAPNKPKPAIMPTEAGTLTAAPVEAVTAEAAAPTRRRKRGSIGGLNLKLSVPDRPGYMRRWVQDKPGRLAQFEELAYSHVTDPAIKSDKPGPVCRHVGTLDGGQPRYDYLMETPLEEYRAGIEEKEEAHREIEEHIRAGRDATGRVQDAYGEGSIGER